MSEHTPGPWSVPHFSEPCANCECGYVLTEGYMGAICTVHCSAEGNDWLKHGDNPKFEEACANARLIAAAPDLLAAVKVALEDSERESTRIILRAAILKATSTTCAQSRAQPLQA